MALTRKGRWSVFAYDINTNTRIAQLPAFGMQFDSRLNDTGSFTGSINLQNRRMQQRLAALLAYEGNPFKLYVDLDGTIMWGGHCWQTNYTKSSGQLDLGGKEFAAWGDLRIAVADYSDQTYPNGIDPAILLGKVISDAQNTSIAGPGASVGLQVITGSSNLSPVVPGYPTTQQTTLQQIINDMIALSQPGVGGLDYTTYSQWVNGLPVDTLHVWSPRAGRIAGQTGLILDLNRALDYTWPSDASQSGNTLIATGAGTGAAMPTATVQAPDVPLGGLGQAPRLDKVMNFSSVQSQDLLSHIANGAVLTYGKPATTPTITLPALGGRGSVQNPLGSWAMGDDARVYTAGDDRFPNGKDEYWRIVQHTVTVPDQGVATVQITLNRPPSY